MLYKSLWIQKSSHIIWLYGLLTGLFVSSNTTFRNFHQTLQIPKWGHVSGHSEQLWSFDPRGPPALLPTSITTTKNEKTPDLAWHKELGPKTLSHLNKESSIFKTMWTKMHCRRLLPYLWSLTNFKNFVRFHNFPNQNEFYPFWATFIFDPI